MIRSFRLFAGTLAGAVLLSPVAGAGPAEVQGKASDSMLASRASQYEPAGALFDDGRVRVQEVTFRPGEVGPNIPRPFRVIRVLAGGTLERIHSDGKTEKLEYRTGEVKVFGAEPPYVLRNAGTTDVVLFVVALKEQPW